MNQRIEIESFLESSAAKCAESEKTDLVVNHTRINNSVLPKDYACRVELP